MSSTYTRGQEHTRGVGRMERLLWTSVTFTLSQVREYLHTTDKTIRRLMKHGQIPCTDHRGVTSFRKVDIDLWIEAIRTLQAYKDPKYHQKDDQGNPILVRGPRFTPVTKM